MDIFKLVGSVFVDTEEANKSLQKTDEKAEGLGSTLKKAGKTVGTAALAMGTAAVGAGTAMVGMANKAAEAADAVDKGSLRMGVSTTYFQELSYAAGQSGVEMATMEAAAKKLEDTDLNMEDAMAQIMALGTETERSQKAAELFGDGLAYKLSPILAMSGDEFGGLMDRANELGIVMSEDSVAAGVKLGDTMSDVQQSFSAVVAEVGVQVMPIIQQLLDWILEHMPEIKEFISNAMTVAQEVFTKVGEVVQWLTEKFDEYWPQIEQTVRVVFDKITEVWNNELKPAFEQVVAFVRDTLWPIIQTVFESYIKPTISAVFNTIVALWNDTLKPVFTNIVDFIKNVFSGDFSGAFQNIVNIVKGIWDGLIDIVKRPVNSIIGVINGMIRGVTGGINSVIRALNRIQISVPQWVTDLTGVKSFGFNLAEVSAPQIPLLAKGGDVQEEGAAIVGEQGAELLQLPKGARVTPLEKAGDTTVNISIDVHPAEGMNEKELADLVAERIQEQVNRRQAAWA